MIQSASTVIATERSAPGKVILCGEHSVVYGRPAIAVPVINLRAHARVIPAPAGAGLRIEAPDLRRSLQLRKHNQTLTGAEIPNPLARAATLVLEYLGLDEPDAVLVVQSDLPIASGMGSGAATAAAAIRALSSALGHDLPAEIVSDLTFEVEKIHHGTPSGIDNTVVAWEQPVYFVKGQPPETFQIGAPFDLLIANSGIYSSTLGAVTEVQHRWNATPGYYDMIFNCIGAIARAARAAVEQGALQALGTLLNENQGLLRKIGVSIPQLDSLIETARDAGALGAKLTGAGQGGNIIALVEESNLPAVRHALLLAGATHIWHTRVSR